MKILHFLKNVPKKVYAITAITAIVAATAVPFAVKATTASNPWGPERPTYDYANGTSQGSTTGPVFNSFTNAPDYGDERNFATVSADGKATWTKDLKVTPGQTIQIRAYVHNDANSGLNGDNMDGISVAHNTRVRFYLPTGSAKGFDVAAYVSADNATPGRVYDTASITDDGQAVSLSYVPGSAKIYNYGAFKNGVALSDDVVGANGTQIGYGALDGNLPGCFDYRATVIISVKVNAPALSFSKQVTKTGQTDWKSSQDAKTGDMVSWLLTFKNVGTDLMHNVVLRDVIPKGLSLVPGSVTWIDSNHPTGKVLPDSAITGSGVNLGDYTGNNGGGYIRFRTTVDKDPKECTITNVAYAKADNIPEQSDKATVIVDDCKTPEKPTPNYACNLLNVTQGDNRTVTISKFEAPASNGATFTNAVIDWNDSSDQLTTNTVVGQTHTYKADGAYKITVSAHFTVNGKDQVASSASCMQTVSFNTPVTPTTPVVPTATTLPNTGMSINDVIAATFAAVIIGTLAHYFVRTRQMFTTK